MEHEILADHISVLDKKRTESVSSISTRSRRGREEERITKMDSVEFLAMAGGGVVLGLSIYFVTFLA